MAVGPSGDIYVAGRAESFFMPTTAGTLQPQKARLEDAFLARISSQAAPTPQPPPPAARSYRLFLPITRR